MARIRRHGRRRRRLVVLLQRSNEELQLSFVQLPCLLVHVKASWRLARLVSCLCTFTIYTNAHDHTSDRRDVLLKSHLIPGLHFYTTDADTKQLPSWVAPKFWLMWILLFVTHCPSANFIYLYILKLILLTEREQHLSLRLKGLTAYQTCEVVQV